ncbi:carbohydrate kinase family protein [candidate division KSB1 bacterium]|nr:carbohydrate kinase family protein [candidate division KSB1 bacterium]
MPEKSEPTLQIYDVVVAGHLCLDIIPRIQHTAAATVGELLRPGSLVNVGPAAVSTGGPVSNTGIGLQKLGMEVAFMSRVSDDDFGQLIVNRLKRVGNASGIITAPGDASSYTIGIAPPGIDRIFLHNPGTNDAFSSTDIDLNIVRQSKIFHLGYPPLMKTLYSNGGEQLQAIFQQAKQAGAVTSLDMSLPDLGSPSAKIAWRDILKNVLPYVDIFLPSIEEAYFMLEVENYLRLRLENQHSDLIEIIPCSIYSILARRCLELGARMVGLKTAQRGIYFRSGDRESIWKIKQMLGESPERWVNRELWCPAFHVDNIASATGSGDSAVAGFLSALIRGKSPERCLKYGNCLGYQNLHELDALSGIKSWDETTQLIESAGLQLNDALVSGAGWRWNEAEQLWNGPDDQR